tara:strand:+ start:787 stop:1614 length:828 start_codon:yes stop_codon:yes gene_type:complete
MSKGVLLFANNNSQIDYVKQACYLAKKINKHLKVPVSLVTSDKKRVTDYYPYEVFDQIIEKKSKNNFSKRYNDGALSHKKLEFNNDLRPQAYKLTPYDVTLMMDTDYIICNDLFKNVFDTEHDLLLYKDSTDITLHRDFTEFKRISDTSIDFYWATCVVFKKTYFTKTFFELIEHIRQEWVHYANVYQLSQRVYRNDYSFSIAVNLMDNHKIGSMPGKMLYSTDKDVLFEVEEDKLKFLVEKKDRLGQYTAVYTDKLNVHVMNKFSLNRMIDGVM